MPRRPNTAGYFLCRIFPVCGVSGLMYNTDCCETDLEAKYAKFINSRAAGTGKKFILTN